MTRLRNYPHNYPQDPKNVWQSFYDLSQIPRPSMKEQQVNEWLINLANERQLKHKSDHIGNLVIYLPASSGYAGKDPVIIQSHTDMVCDKVPGHDFDFDKDSLELLVQDGWVTAHQTTLGADNGIGVAFAVALMLEQGLKHPPLELLFTVEEESGLTGAKDLDASMLHGRQIINIDTEEWGSLYVGCAGGKDIQLVGEYQRIASNSSWRAVDLFVSGLIGGHSGIDIHRSRGNAIKILVETLQEIDWEYELIELHGGTAHNIIPRDAHATLLMPTNTLAKLEELGEKMRNQMICYLASEEKTLSITCRPTEISNRDVIQDKRKILDMLCLFPHGATSYDWSFSTPLVSLSSNLAIAKIHSGKIDLLTFLRFSDKQEVVSLERKLKSLSATYQLDMQLLSEHPAWKPVAVNHLLEVFKKEHQKLFEKPAAIKAIHAGLECGILKERLGGAIDAISFGPNITGAHSPSEALDICSTGKCWQLLVKVLQQL